MRNQEPRRVDMPIAGWFRVRLVRNGWKVPALVEQNSEGMWRAIVDEQPTGWFRDPFKSEDICRVWEFGAQIQEYEYLDLLASKLVAPPDHPSRNPRVPMNPMTTTLVVPKRTTRKPRRKWER
jgi:hypothetical protein